jgi:probable F420-dependent oxidoreductase
MRISVGLPIDRHGIADELLTIAGIQDCARALETAGVDACFVTDHPAPDMRWLRHGGHPTLDPFVALSVAASATTTLRLHTNLLVLPYRNPFLAAKSVASLDALSGGRMILGVGVGYLEAEFAALGVPMDERARRADEALAAMTAAWSGEPVQSTGSAFEARDTVVLPRPAQEPHPPIWVGGNSRAAMRRAIQFGQGWSPMPSPRSAASFLGTPGIEGVAELADRIAQLHQMAADAGRTEPLDVAVIPTQVTVFGDAGGSTQALVDEIAALREAGGTWLVVNLPGHDIATFTEALETFASDIVPHAR